MCTASQIDRNLYSHSVCSPNGKHSTRYFVEETERVGNQVLVGRHHMLSTTLDTLNFLLLTRKSLYNIILASPPSRTGPEQGLAPNLLPNRVRLSQSFLFFTVRLMFDPTTKASLGGPRPSNCDRVTVPVTSVTLNSELKRTELKQNWTDDLYCM